MSQCGITFDDAALKRARIPDSVFTGPGLPLTPPAVHRNGSAVRTSQDASTKHMKALEEYGYGSGRRSGESAFTDATDGTCSTDAVDVAMPIHDQLAVCPWWWLLECVPTNYAYQDGRGVWHDKWS